jgi:hypothetical protein
MAISLSSLTGGGFLGAKSEFVYSHDKEAEPTRRSDARDSGDSAVAVTDFNRLGIGLLSRWTEENPKMRGLLILPCVALLACAYTPRPPQPYTTYIPEMGHRRAVAWSDGTIILLHPTHFVLTGVVNVEPNYALKLRAGPGTRFNVVAAIPADATGILAFDKDAVWDGDTWWYPVEWQGFRGYVSGDYLPHP